MQPTRSGLFMNLLLTVSAVGPRNATCSGFPRSWLAQPPCGPTAVPICTTTAQTLPKAHAVPTLCSCFADEGPRCSLTGSHPNGSQPRGRLPHP